LVKYVIFKDDDAGKDFNNLKKWINIIIKNDAKAAIGLIGKFISKDTDLVKYLNKIDDKKIEIFCHGYSHAGFPFLVMKYWRKNRIFPTEFNRNFKKHNESLKKYRLAESKYLKKKSITFGPAGNIWNETAVDAVLQNDFKIMFSWEKASHNLFTIPLCDNFRRENIDEFIKVYSEKKDKLIYVLQFHHATLTDKQYKILPDVISYLINEEKRVFIKPSELLSISKKDKKIFKLIAPENLM